MIARFLTRETLLLYGAGLVIVVAACVLSGFGPLWTLGFAAGYTVLVYPSLAMRLQDRLLEYYVATGRFDRALALAAAIRDGARFPVPKALAAFDLALVHLARGAPVDAKRVLGGIQKHRLRQRTRLLVEVHEALAALRAAGPDEAGAPASALVAAAEAALREFPGDPHVLALQGEALLAQGKAAEAHALLRRSLELDGDASDPSPGERHVLFARAATAAGAHDEATAALELVAALPASGPYVDEAKATLARTHA